MKKSFVLFNPHSSNENGEDEAKKISKYVKEKLEFVDMTKIESYSDFFGSLGADDVLYICGGDGTLNRIINNCEDKFPENDIYFFGIGTGNDFLLDIGYKTPCAPVKVNEYLKDLPTVEINGKIYYFLNNVAYGIDGWVCGIAEEEKKKHHKVKSNYTIIALKGLLGQFKPLNSRVVIDGGEPMHFHRVWMSPTMNGRYFGGGMKVTPMQDRLNKDRSLTYMTCQNSNRFQITTAFITIFGGKHINNPTVKFFTGHEVTVEFDRPMTLNIDGEPIYDVLKYTARKK